MDEESWKNEFQVCDFYCTFIVEIRDVQRFDTDRYVLIYRIELPTSICTDLYQNKIESKFLKLLYEKLKRNMGEIQLAAGWSTLPQL